MMRVRLVAAVVGAAACAGAAAAWAGDTICIEAEAAPTLVKPMIVVTSATDAATQKLLHEASGGQFLEITQGVGKPPDVGGEAVFPIDVKEAGEYWLWARVWWMDCCGNSMSVVVDSHPPFILGEDGTYGIWHWVKGMKLKLTAGRHDIHFQNREDGVRLDQFLLSKDHTYVPVGAEDPTPGALATEKGK